jgi:hypothetical protein
MKRQVRLYIAILLLAGCTPISPSATTSSGSAKVLKLEDATYEKEIKTVRLFRRGSPLSPAVTQLGVWEAWRVGPNA